MRKRLLPVGVAMALGLGILTAAPATASYAVESITFPGLDSEFYSPFAGPALIKFTFDGSENDATFTVRLRPAGGAAVYAHDFLVDADDPDGFQIKTFDWPAVSVSSAKTYVVAVYRNSTQVATESFLLQPRLVTITGASPNPFLPWVDDDIKDETHISYKLVAASDPTIIKVYAANTQGKCCAPSPVFEQDDGAHPQGTNQYTWNGRTAEVGGTLLPKGDYFVRIAAEDPANVVQTSKPFKVTIARTYRALTTLEKSATAYHHVGPVSVYLRGGNCFLTNAQTDLWITCLHAKITIYWRWSLPNGGRIEKVRWTFLPLSVPCKFTKGHTTTDSWMRVGATSGQVRCRVDKAKITYSRPVPS